MWVVPDTAGIEPGYEQLDVNDALTAGGLVTVASGRGDAGAITIHQQGAAMYVARMHPGDAVTVPDGPFVHVFVARGEVELPGTRLGTGDAARLTNAGPLTMAAGEASEVIVWESDNEVQR
jgi:redox-sensitive bicupin YhaK (pirin superfamily)